MLVSKVPTIFQSLYNVINLAYNLREEKNIVKKIYPENVAQN